MSAGPDTLPSFEGVPAAAEDAAAYWDAKLRSPDCSPADREAFCVWRDASPENTEAFGELQALLGALRDNENGPEIRAMREDALNLIERAQGRRRAFMGAGIAASIALLAGAFIAFQAIPIWNGPPREITLANSLPAYETAIGERSTIALEDGTVATLNTDSRMEVDYSGAERLVTLLQGQALFEVAKDPNRTFVVAAGDRRIEALGTIFDVRYIDDEIQVTLLEGLVEVAGDDEPVRIRGAGESIVPPAPQQLIPGQQLLASVNVETAEIRDADAERAVIWREGRVSFEDTPLTDAIAEMNRYSTKRILAGDRALEDIRINGVFFTGQQTNFVGALESYLPVKAERRANGDIVIKLSRERRL